MPGTAQVRLNFPASEQAPESAEDGAGAPAWLTGRLKTVGPVHENILVQCSPEPF